LPDIEVQKKMDKALGRNNISAQME